MANAQPSTTIHLSSMPSPRIRTTACAAESSRAWTRTSSDHSTLAGTFLWVRWLIAATILSSQLVLASAEVANGLDAPRNLDDVPEVALA
jgi:hypothetical protein